jgi:succinate dehydrogenase / fumarate reductase membrane anchor subunit
MIMSLETNLGRARGLGSAKEGVEHWWMQRVSSVALIPLTLWFVYGVATLAGEEFATVHAWIAAPFNAVMMILFISTTFYHTQLGLQVVIEDYVHGEGVKITSLLLLKFTCVGLTIASVFAILKIAFGG